MYCMYDTVRISHRVCIPVGLKKLEPAGQDAAVGVAGLAAGAGRHGSRRTGFPRRRACTVDSRLARRQGQESSGRLFLVSFFVKSPLYQSVCHMV